MLDIELRYNYFPACIHHVFTETGEYPENDFVTLVHSPGTDTIILTHWDSAASRPSDDTLKTYTLSDVETTYERFIKHKNRKTRKNDYNFLKYRVIADVAIVQISYPVINPTTKKITIQIPEEIAPIDDQYIPILVQYGRDRIEDGICCIKSNGELTITCNKKFHTTLNTTVTYFV